MNIQAAQTVHSVQQQQHNFQYVQRKAAAAVDKHHQDNSQESNCHQNSYYQSNWCSNCKVKVKVVEKVQKKSFLCNKQRKDLKN